MAQDIIAYWLIGGIVALLLLSIVVSWIGEKLQKK